ncbi:MAG: hypothetical protein GWM98_08740, partial [Nitrospinaceae bacterium]|nr:hypothetical protein [Nitrospinaceae bacterium]NIR54559.1 hypothetical protein [Nitrospinaceae bacterium]NIS84978.1 hypothetical protein [Nitrospinaceae bacterium]NIT81789.1 hypothetical protein [Nitrospinaceae bacterium]NIU46279.1 hypothetical protein [Nitrospinaceae bacterium]
MLESGRLDNWGTIDSSNGNGVIINNSPLLLNHGSISGNRDGVRLFNDTADTNFTFVNSLSGTIDGAIGVRATNDGSNGTISFTNRGDITGTFYGALLENRDTVGSGAISFTNRGTIQAISNNGAGILIRAPLIYASNRTQEPVVGTERKPAVISGDTAIEIYGSIADLTLQGGL